MSSHTVELHEKRRGTRGTRTYVERHRTSNGRWHPTVEVCEELFWTTDGKRRRNTRRVQVDKDKLVAALEELSDGEAG